MSVVKILWKFVVFILRSVSTKNMSVMKILNIMKICCVSILFQIELFILFHVRGMVCLIEKYERTFLRGVGKVPPLPYHPVNQMWTIELISMWSMKNCMLLVIQHFEWNKPNKHNLIEQTQQPHIILRIDTRVLWDWPWSVMEQSYCPDYSAILLKILFNLLNYCVDHH